MVGHGAEDLEVRLEIFAKRHDGRHVAATVAVIGCRPDGHDFLRLKVVFVALVHKLMGAGYQLQIVDVVELRVLAKG